MSTTPQPAPLAHCQSCQAPILWAVHERTGKRAPLDAVPTPAGNCQLHADGRYAVYRNPTLAPAGPLYTSHFQTCPHAQTWQARPR